MTPQERISTHWDGCWREHRDCAAVKVAELQKRIAELIDQNKELARRLDIETDRLIDRERRIAELEVAIRFYIEDPDVLYQALKGGAK